MEVYSISTVMQGMQKEYEGTSAANKQEQAPARGDYSVAASTRVRPVVGQL